MDNGDYTNIVINNVPELKNDEYIQELISEMCNFYDEFLFNRDGTHMDNDTSYQVYADGTMDDGLFYCTKMIIEFSFLDEMNDVVEQTLHVNFCTGETWIMDDNDGCLYHKIIDAFGFYR